MNYYAILAAGAVAIVGIVEVLIASQKSQMKKQFLDELARVDDKQTEAAPNDANTTDAAKEKMKGKRI